MLLSMLANIHRADRTTVYKPEDFMPGLTLEDPVSEARNDDSGEAFDPHAASATVAKLLGIKDE